MATDADMCSPPHREETLTATYPRWGHLRHARARHARNHFCDPRIRLAPLSDSSQEVERLLQTDTTRIGTHSLRIGGTSTLVAAGLTDNEITRIGSWRSTAFLIIYLRQNFELFEKARTAMASEKHLTLEDVRRFNQN